MTDWSAPATPGQLAELRLLAETLHEDVPDGLRAHEAAQRLDEFRRHVAEVEGTVIILGGEARRVEEIHSVLL